MARTGYTLPVFAVAAAKAALTYLHQPSQELEAIALELLPGTTTIAISQVARLDAATALAIAISDPGDNLDLTRHTPLWAWVRLSDRHGQALVLEAGEGLGRDADGKPAIYSYAQRLFEHNLLPLVPGDRQATVRLILPEGRRLAARTSNAAFGILEGLALLGTSGISRPLSAVDQLERFRVRLRQQVKTLPHLTFCLGSNGQRVATQLGIVEQSIVQTGNWLGALLVEAALHGAKSVLLVGYHGKLVKLAGGIFNTSSHIADARLEVLAATVARHSEDLSPVQGVLTAPTADAAYQKLVQWGMASTVFADLAEQISQKSRRYVQKYGDRDLMIGTLLFDRQGKVIALDAGATELLTRNKLAPPKQMG